MQVALLYVITTRGIRRNRANILWMLMEFFPSTRVIKRPTKFMIIWGHTRELDLTRKLCEIS